MEKHQNIALSFKCPKQLNQLQAVNGDYYCDGCQKIVHDFRGMTEAQVLETIARNSRQTCGIFEAERITVLPQHGKWLKWASAAMLFLGVTGIHDRLFAQTNKQPDSLTNNQRVLMGKSHRILPGQKFSKQAIINSTKDITNLGVFGMVEETGPSYPGGQEKLMEYISKHLKNPKGIAGKSIVTFVVERDGTISEVKMLKSADPSLDNEVVSLIKNMPKWKPGFQNSKPTRMQYSLPVTFGK